MPTERTGLVTFKGNGITLVGQPVKAGDAAPDFQLLANDLSPRSLASYPGKTLLIITVPSLDTGVCNLETRKFNQEAEKLGDQAKVLSVSCDLPFAQARWAAEAEVKALETLSDHRDLSFGLAYGVLIKELRLLARAVFVVNPQGMVTYTELAPNVSDEPNYEAALAAARKTL